MTKGNRIDVTIQGQKFRLRCEEDEQADLEAAAAAVNQKIAELMKGGVADSHRAALMAAFHFAFEAGTQTGGSYRQSAEYKKIQQRLKTLVDEIDTNLSE